MIRKITFTLLLFCNLITFAQTPISDVHGQLDASPMVNQAVTIQGIVTASKSGQGYFVQDGDSAWTGIFIYDLNRLPMPAIGDEVRLTGMVTEYYNLTEIKDVTSFEVISTGNALPEPILLKTGEIGEPYEGVLVKIEAAECTQVSLGFGEWQVNDGSGTVVIDDMFYVFTPTLGVNYDITGPLTFTYDFYKIEPLSSSDVVINASVYFTVKPYQTKLSKTSVTIEWETNTAATSEVLYGKTEAFEMGVIKMEEMAIIHQITIGGLDAGELYYAKAFSVFDADTTPVEIKSYATISNSSGEIRVLIFNAVKAKAASGVKVRVITNNESTDPFFTGLLEHAQVVWGNNDGIMHHKYLVIDAENEQESWLVTGSVNWTYNNLKMDANNLIMIQDRSLAKAYTAEFNEMWGGSQFEPDYEKGRFGSQKTDNTPHLFEIGGKRTALYFSPSDLTESKIVKALKTADHQIAFSMMAFTSDALG